jgi:hypothetical protein
MHRRIIVRWLFEGDVRILGIPHIRSHRRPVPLARRCRRECWSRRALRFSAFREDQYLWLLIGIARTRTRMPLDHPLGREERLNLFAQDRNAVGLLNNEMRIAESCRQGETNPHPFRALGTEAKALKTKTNACLAIPLRVRLLVALLSPYPTGVAARLSAHCTFSFGRPGFLGYFSYARSGGRRYAATDGGIVGHLGLAKE